MNAPVLSEDKKDSQAQVMPYCPVKFIKGVNGNTFEAHILGDIRDVDDYIDLIDTLLTATENDTYHIYIDSPGGYISAGSIIASAIEHSKAKVYTHAVGLCASAACLIHNAAHEGFATVEEFGILMIHMSLHSDMGVSSQIAHRASDQVRYVLENLLRQARDMGYIYDNELESIQTGENIYISATDFAKRVEAKRKGERAESLSESQPDEPISGTEDFELQINNSRFGETCPLYFPNMSSCSPIEYLEKCRMADDVLTDELARPNINNMDMIAKVRLIKANTLRVRTYDKHNYRIYMPSDLMFSRSYIAQLCLFLDSMKQDDTVTFVLGAKILDDIACNLGAVIAAMKRCRGTIITIAAGYCSIPESIIWTYGTIRKVYRYGALTFGKTEIVRVVKKYDDYFKAALAHACEIKILTEQDIVELNKFKTKLILSQDLKDPLGNPQMYE